MTSEQEEESQALALSEKERGNSDYVEGPVYEGPDFGDEPNGKTNRADDDVDDVAEATAPHSIRPFEAFQDLPDDVSDACNAFKIAIIRHKSEQWEEISREDMLGLFDALKQLASIEAV